ncbi:glycosyltransferase [Cellulosimicrobium cellulans]|uniref:glycosyltransferase n=1 Tax=Cellulosimicrobium cellulans TaxID=1710 RepID=UPI0019651B03|nr:glycosyltransferase [Cellulosimicrobium cellulans]MBN0039671.1 glycosyltransferase [Cellulosimicrobium cellulans]
MPDVTYVLPLRRDRFDERAAAELSRYLARLLPRAEVVVADGSPAEVRARHAASWPDGTRTVAVPAPPPGCNGKVVGVLAALAAASTPAVVLADDDVRWDAATLDEALAALDDADLVVPQNVFDPAPWHARWDTARSLVNRALGHDWSGTVVLRRDALGPEGYDARVLFENLELERTALARGGRVVHRPDLFVDRRPPRVRTFLEQRVRQAYDSFAQPARLTAELALAPVLAACVAGAARSDGAWRAAWTVVVVIVLGSAALVAEVGRRAAGGAAAWPPTAALWAPAWLLERAVCAWVALGWRLRGGVPYRGTRIRRAAHSLEELRAASGEAPR